MADEVTENQDVLDESTTEEVGDKSTGQQPETLTLAQIQKLLDEQARRIQSQLDKREAGLMKRLTRADQLKAVQEKHKLTPEALADLQGALKDDDAAAAPETQKPDRTTIEGPTDEQVNATAQRLYAKYGISGDDPEAALIDVTGTAEDFIESIIHAGRTRQARLKQGATEQRRSPARAPGMTPGGGRPVERAAGKSKSDLLEAEIDRMFSK